MLITAYYQFTPLATADQQHLKTTLEGLAEVHGLRGLCLVGPEGINLTASGEAPAIDALKALLTRQVNARLSLFKDAHAERHPFQNFKVKLRAEIVTLGRPDLRPVDRGRHLSPRAWHAALKNPDALVLDTRNDYEVALGKFRGAVDFDTREFREFPERARAAGIAKDKPILMYCTGGIRCEKAILELEEQGFTDVHQLDGGILNYLNEYPHQEFEGECFVFDYRVAVDQELKPTRSYTLCPHCGQPARGQSQLRAVRGRGDHVREVRG